MAHYLERINQQMELYRMLQQSGLNTYSREVSSGCGPTIVVEGKECINFISNSYMGFSMHPKVVEAARKALKKYGMGIGGSPLASGTTTLHLRLCEKIAANYGREAALLFPTGYQALLGTIQGLLVRGDLALLDNLDHRSIIDGCALSGCKIRTFVHNNMEDLRELVSATGGEKGHRMVIVDSIYSMDGDIAPLPEINQICRPADVTIMVDEAHSLGILGKTGKGILEHFDMPGGADIISGTFSKFAGAVGGFMTGSKELVDFFKVNVSPFVFSASLPPAIVAAVTTSFELLQTEPEWLHKLWENINFVHAQLREMGYDLGKSNTAVIPIMIRDTATVLQMNRQLLNKGVFCSPVVHPGVPLKSERIRLGVMATHTRSHLERAMEMFRAVGRDYGVIF